MDGTSIDAREDIARLLGLDAEPVMMPVDHVLVDESVAPWTRHLQPPTVA